MKQFFFFSAVCLSLAWASPCPAVEFDLSFNGGDGDILVFDNFKTIRRGSLTNRQIKEGLERIRSMEDKLNKAEDRLKKMDELERRLRQAESDLKKAQDLQKTQGNLERQLKKVEDRLRKLER